MTVRKNEYDLANKTGRSVVLSERKQGVTDYVQMKSLRW